MRRSLFALSTAGLLGLASCAAPDSDALRYDFDDGLAAGDQGSYVEGARFDGQVRVQGDAGVEEVDGQGGDGRALRFPPRCDGGAACPQVILEVPDDETLDPGGTPFTYGAAVLLDRDELTGGSNVVQKGYYTDPTGQWKLQVDKEDGRPSCVVQGSRDGERTRAVVVADIGVADGQWHTVTCSKRDDHVAIEVDGEEHGREDVRVGSVSNDAPVRIGGKGILDDGDNDQFHGALDDVFLRVE